MKKLLFLFPIVLTAQIQQYPGASGGGGGSVTITSPGGSLNVGGTPSAPTLDVSTTYLNGLYVQLSPTSAQSITPGATGARTNFVNTAATGGLTLSGSNIPSNLHAGDIGTNLSGFFWVDDGTNVNIVPWVAGSGTTVATAPTSGQVATWGTAFTQVGFPGLTNTQPAANETQVTVTAGSSDDNTGNSIFRVRSSNGTTFLDVEANSAASGGRVGLYGSSSYIADLSGNTYQIGQDILKVSSGWHFGQTSSDFTGTADIGYCRPAANILEFNDGSATCDSTTLKDIASRNVVSPVGTVISSSATIAPTTAIVHVSGTTTINTITAPANFAVSGFGGCIRLIPDGAWSTGISGNIAIASTAVVNVPITECYDNATSKWYPSYTTPPNIALPSPGTSITLAAPGGIAVCTGTCTITIPLPTAGAVYCAVDDVAVTSAITISNPGTSTQFGKTDGSAYGTATTGTAASTAGTNSKICFFGRDTTHYVVESSAGTWTMN